MAIIAGAQHDKGDELARTMGVTTFGIANLMFSFTARDRLRSVFTLETFRDRTFLITSLMSVFAIILATDLQFLHRILKTEELTGNQWLICIAGGLVIIAVSEIWKFFLRRSEAAQTETPPVEVAA
jgi:Ca2+-transporting ATPase